jgi:hypothetical protein
LKNIFRIVETVLSILFIFLIHSCKKDLIESDIDRYLIEMNGDFRISRLTHFVSDNILEYDKVFDYSDKYVKVYSNDILICTYFLNNAGLADSCLEGNYRIMYHYNNDNY